MDANKNHPHPLVDRAQPTVEDKVITILRELYPQTRDVAALPPVTMPVPCGFPYFFTPVGWFENMVVVVVKTTQDSHVHDVLRLIQRLKDEKLFVGNDYIGGLYCILCQEELGG